MDTARYSVYVTLLLHKVHDYILVVGTGHRYSIVSLPFFYLFGRSGSRTNPPRPVLRPPWCCTVYVCAWCFFTHPGAQNENHQRRAMAQRNDISLEEGWAAIQAKAVDVLVDQLKNKFDAKAMPFDNKAFMEVYSTCYNMCTQRAPNNFSEQLYTKHGRTMTDYLRDVVFNAIKSETGDKLLTELNDRWNGHKVMNKWMMKFFQYLDRYYVKHHSQKTLKEVGIMAFKYEVYLKTKEEIVKAMLSAIEKERVGEEVDHSLLKSCVAIFEVMGEGSLEVYINDFQDQLLTETENFYRAKSAEWRVSDDTPTYLLKAENVLKKEEQRVDDYLIGYETKDKLLSVCDKQLLREPQKELLERPNSGCAALLKNNKHEDLKRMFQLFR